MFIPVIINNEVVYLFYIYENGPLWTIISPVSIWKIQDFLYYLDNPRASEMLRFWRSQKPKAVIKCTVNEVGLGPDVPDNDAMRPLVR
jgi:hypothetical protein